MIRPARFEDLDAIKGLLAENGMLADGLDYSDFTQPTLVYVRDGAVLGMIQALAGKPHAVITHAAVSRAHHHRGIGIRLLEAVELVLRTMGVTAWYACTSSDDVVKILDGYGAEPTGQGTSFLRRLA